MNPLTLAHTEPIPEAPDIGPGMGQARDQALDADARQGNPADDIRQPNGPGEASTAQAAQDVDDAIAAARAALGLNPRP